MGSLRDCEADISQQSKNIKMWVCIAIVALLSVGTVPCISIASNESKAPYESRINAAYSNGVTCYSQVTRYKARHSVVSNGS